MGLLGRKVLALDRDATAIRSLWTLLKVNVGKAAIRGGIHLVGDFGEIVARKLVPTMLPLVALQRLNLKHLVVVDVQRCLIHVDRKLRLVFLHLALRLGPHVHGVLRHGVLENSSTSSGIDVERGISLTLRVKELGTLHVARSSSDSRV